MELRFGLGAEPRVYRPPRQRFRTQRESQISGPVRTKIECGPARYARSRFATREKRYAALAGADALYSLTIPLSTFLASP